MYFIGRFYKQQSLTISEDRSNVMYDFLWCMHARNILAIRMKNSPPEFLIPQLYSIKSGRNAILWKLASLLLE